MTTAARSLLLQLQLALLFVLVACISVFVPSVFLLCGCSTLVLMAFSLALMLYFSDHIIDPDTRRYLVTVSGLIVLWVTLRGAKYIAFEETEVIARHIWYLYYVPALLIPLFSLFTALSVGKREWRVRPKTIRFAVVFTGLLIALILTNDLHGLVFRFAPGFAGWDADYTHGPVFPVVYLWILLLTIGVFYILLSRCRLSASRKLVWIPLLPVLFGVTYLVLYTLDLWPRIHGNLFGEFPEAVCFSLAGIWLGLIRIGLIPSNAGYGRLFELSSLAAQIADRSYRVIYRSGNAAPLSREQMASSSDVLLEENTRVHRKPVAGGYVYWQDDIAELNRLNGELREVGETLAEEASLLRLKNELAEQRARIEAKTRVYDVIAEQVLPQSRRIDALCAQAQADPALYAQNMKTVCLLAVYIKRYANLSLLAAEHEEIAEGELFLAVSESLRWVREMGIPALETPPEQAQPIPSRRALQVYALFETILESALPSLTGLQVSFRGGTLRIAAEGGEIPLPQGCDAQLETEGGVSYVRIPLREAGAPV